MSLKHKRVNVADSSLWLAVIGIMISISSVFGLIQLVLDVEEQKTVINRVWFVETTPIVTLNEKINEEVLPPIAALPLLFVRRNDYLNEQLVNLCDVEEAEYWWIDVVNINCLSEGDLGQGFLHDQLLALPLKLVEDHIKCHPRLTAIAIIRQDDSYWRIWWQANQKYPGRFADWKTSREFNLAMRDRPNRQPQPGDVVYLPGR